LTFNSEKELASLLRLGRKSGLVLVGPFWRPNGTLVFGIADTVISESERRELKEGGKPSLASIQDGLNRGPRLKEIANEGR
jgi:hypothetical protein